MNPIDTVGAGDGFDAGYIYAYLHEYEPIERLKFANGVGALVTTVSGDNEGLPELQKYLLLFVTIKLLNDKGGIIIDDKTFSL